MDKDDDHTVLSEAEKARLASLLADNTDVDTKANHDELFGEGGNLTFDTLQAAQERLRQIDSQLRNLQTPRVLGHKGTSFVLIFWRPH